MSAKEYTAAMIASVTSALTTNVTVPVMGASVTTIGAAFIGSVLSFFFGDPATSRRQLFGMVILGTVIGSVAAAMLPHLWSWTAQVQGPVAIVCALVTRHLLPPAVERGKELIKSFSPTNLFKKDGGR